jgi:two-component system, OmpR family, response regulator ResD
MKYKVLFLEDSTEIQSAVAMAFRKECVFTFAGMNREAQDTLEKEKFDLVLLDLTLPDGDGFKVCNFIRRSEALRDIPIIFLTGRDEIEDKEMAFSIGADDYIVKPVDMRELRARVLSRLKKVHERRETLTVGDLKFDLARQRICVVREDGESVLETTSREFRILFHLAKREGQVFSRDQLLTEVWGENIHLLERTVDTHVSHLRKKLKEAGASITIKPVHGFGYKLASAKESKVKAA